MTGSIKYIFSQFQTNCSFKASRPFGSGHINNTYLIAAAAEEEKQFILQQINQHVFPNVAELQSNILKITREIQSKLYPFQDKACLFLFTTHSGSTFYQDDSTGQYWRLFPFIENSQSFDQVLLPEIAFESGLAFGLFLNHLAEMDTDSVYEIIPDFHNIEFRYQQFEHALQHGSSQRKKSAVQETNFVKDRIESLSQILEMEKRGVLKSRIVHNDSKINNVLFDSKTSHWKCVIDLDTVMKGLPHYDYGDSVRTITSSAAEDESDLDKVYIHKTYFQAFTRGFLNHTSRFLTQTEAGMLAEGARYMCFIIGLRFLTDFLSGDIYYKTKYGGHNLTRARVQFKLVRDIEKNISEFNDFVMNEYWRNRKK